MKAMRTNDLGCADMRGCRQEPDDERMPAGIDSADTMNAAVAPHAPSPVRLIAGLGNPGARYAETRHNAGAWLVERLARRWDLELRADSRWQGRIARVSSLDRNLWLLVPTGMMNNSGAAVAAVKAYFRLAVDEILVAHDELDLPVGRVRLKRDGGVAGHNGLKDIRRALGGNGGFARLRIGIGHPGAAGKVTEYVLGKAPEDERTAVSRAIDTVLEHIDAILSGCFEQVMNRLHPL